MPEFNLMSRVRRVATDGPIGTIVGRTTPGGPASDGQGPTYSVVWDDGATDRDLAGDQLELSPPLRDRQLAQ